MSAASTQARLWRIGAVYALALGAVLVHLAFVMVGQHEAWLVRSYQNRWSFRDVPSVRGALRDRFDRPLAHDEPTFELGCVYERFRMFHPVGAAVHGASLWARLAGRGDLAYSYTDFATGSTAGPAMAAHDLLSLPLHALTDAEFDKEDRRALVQSVLVVLTACSERSTAEVRRELRAALASSPRLRIGDALVDRTTEQLEEQFAAILARLRSLDATLRELLPPRRAAAVVQVNGDVGEVEADDDDPRGMLARLDGMRASSLAGKRTQHEAADGTIEPGELKERMLRPLLRSVPFAIAAAIRVAADDQPGLQLEPSLRRVPAPELPATLQQLLGGVAALDDAERFGGYVEQRVESAVGDELEELVPGELGPSPEFTQALRVQAERSYAHVLRTRERRGISGFEAMLDSELRGTPGLRLVEHDARAKEQLLWGNLRVLPGNDVQLTIDLDLQALLERRVLAAAEHWQGIAGSAAGKIDVACALVDASSGDVLALASAPNQTADGKPRLPGVLTWAGNGAIGSLSKPLFLVEHYAAAAAGRPHKDLATFDPCNRRYKVIGGQKLDCDSTHGQGGTRPVTALAKSCNTFFFQLAEGIGEAGQRRALWRFGLLPWPDADDLAGDDGRLQTRPPELPAGLAAAPRWGRGAVLMQKRGIGYGIEANPLSLARAYAALASGMLPTLGCRRGEQRPRYPLGIADDELDVVREGLRECVESGTAKDLKGLRDFDVRGKTGTAEISDRTKDNNAWFAGWLPVRAQDGVQLCFCAVVYAVPNLTHGADAGGALIEDVLRRMADDDVLRARYLVPVEGR